ncbi:MAG: histidine triad nucleotide-binding protein [Nitrospinae bacterium]|nr:histidine triad nucleotide-binding protein [Nitrospinota bacterium]
MSACIFCKIAAGEIPSKKVMETDTIFAFEDIHPQAPAHILIVPKRHIESSLAFSKDEASLLCEIFLAANDIARQRGLDKKGFRIVTNTGLEAGQSVFHVHFHLLGGRPMGWPPG